MDQQSEKPRPFDFPAEEMLMQLRRIDCSATRELAAFLTAGEEYVAAELLELSYSRARLRDSHEVEMEDVQAAIRDDNELINLFGAFLSTSDNHIRRPSSYRPGLSKLASKNTTTATYSATARHLLTNIVVNFHQKIMESCEEAFTTTKGAILDHRYGEIVVECLLPGSLKTYATAEATKAIHDLRNQARIIKDQVKAPIKIRSGDFIAGIPEVLKVIRPGASINEEGQRYMARLLSSETNRLVEVVAEETAEAESVTHGAIMTAVYDALPENLPVDVVAEEELVPNSYGR